MLTEHDLKQMEQWAGGGLAQHSTREDIIESLNKTDTYLVKALAEIRCLQGVLQGIVGRHDSEDTGVGFTRGGGMAWAMADDARNALGRSSDEPDTEKERRN